MAMVQQLSLAGPEAISHSAAKTKGLTSAPFTSTPFISAPRVQCGLLAGAEKRALLWLAERMPQRVNSDHLTVLGMGAMVLAGLSYWWARYNHLGLLGAIVCLALNWFGDSLDGTLARVRNRQRPRYGFYVDHMVDAFSAIVLFGGLALSGYMSAGIAAALLLSYLVLAIEVYLATYTIGTFTLSFFSFSPTELRILLSIGNLALFLKGHPQVHCLGHVYSLFDFGGAIGAAGMMAVALVSFAKNAHRLYAEERIR